MGREGFLEEVTFELAPEGCIGIHTKLRVVNESGFQVEGPACVQKAPLRN